MSKAISFIFISLLKISFISLFLGNVYAQQKNIPLSHAADWLYDFTDNNNLDKQALHTALKPVVENAERKLLSNYSFLNSIALAKQLDSNYSVPRRNKWLKRKLKQESFIVIDDTTDEFHLTIDPLFNFQVSNGEDRGIAQNFYTNTRGLIVCGDIGENFSFESSFYENQSTFPAYINNNANNYKVIPGQGRWKRFKTNGYDYAMASGYLSYSPSKHFNLQLGHGKHFVGDGYRSLLLSDNAFNYPYFKAAGIVGSFQYTTIYAVLLNLNSSSAVAASATEALFQKKAAAFQFLSYNINKRIQFGLFQGMIWEASDSKNRQHLHALYFNPVIFTNATVYSLRNTNNVLLGSTLKLKLFKNLYLYGQVVIDDIDAKNAVYNKHGFQLGFKGYNLFSIKNMRVVAEYNQVRPYTYSHERPAQSYSHYNQALAHPLGANFRELVGLMSYRYKDFIASTKVTYAKIGTDGNYNNNLFPQSLTLSIGNSVFFSDITGNANATQNQGIELTITNIDFSISYLVNPINNMQLVGGVNYIAGHSAVPLNLIYVSFKTALSNFYFDF